MASKQSPMIARAAVPENWTKSGLPETISDAKTSLKFVKRLLLISVSQIAYLRSNLPDDSFTPKSIGDIELKVLKGKSSSKAVSTICAMLQNSLKALDKGYLRAMVLIFYDNEDKPEEILESYSFNFSRSKTSDGDMTTTGMSISKNGETVFEPDAQNLQSGTQHIYKNTKRLLRRLIMYTQNLPELPEPSFINVRLGYYDDITPADYQPPGFLPASKEVHFGGLEPASYDMGHVKSGFHAVSLKLSTLNPCDFTAEDGLSMHSTMNESTMEDVVEGKKDLNTSTVPLAPGLDVTAGSELSPGANNAAVIKQMESMDIQDEKCAMMQSKKEKAVEKNKGADLNSSVVSNKSNIRRKRSVGQVDSFGRGLVNDNAKVSRATRPIRI